MRNCPRIPSATRLVALGHYRVMPLTFKNFRASGLSAIALAISAREPSGSPNLLLTFPRLRYGAYVNGANLMAASQSSKSSLSSLASARLLYAFGLVGFNSIDLL